MSNILVHSCCAPCATYSFEKLVRDGFSVTGFFYNPNIQPQAEYERRRDEFIRFVEHKKLNYILDESNFKEWLLQADPFALAPEGGTRCEMCYRFRLEKTAQIAKTRGFDCFTTVLTISPHKNSDKINKIGLDISEKYGVKYIPENFKKKDGFKKSLLYSAELGLYRQEYCGCLFAKK